MSEQPATKSGTSIVARATLGESAADRQAAERELCIMLAPRLRLYGLRHLRDEHAAADLVQEALAEVLESLRAGRIGDPALIGRFALGVCRNLIAHSRRAGIRTKNFERAALPLAAEVLPLAYSQVDATRLALCLGMLDRRDQRVVLMTFQEDRDAAQIASALALTVSNVRVIRHRTLSALRRCVAGEAR